MLQCKIICLEMYFISCQGLENHSEVSFERHDLVPLAPYEQFRKAKNPSHQEAPNNFVSD